MKKGFKILFSIIAVIVLLNYGVYWMFFDLQRIEGQEVIHEVVSPDGSNTIVAYLNNGGATTSYAVLCAVKNNESGKERNIYWQYRCTDAMIEWVDEDTAIINGKELDVWKDSYDF